MGGRACPSGTVFLSPDPGNVARGWGDVKCCGREVCETWLHRKSSLGSRCFSLSQRERKALCLYTALVLGLQLCEHGH